MVDGHILSWGNAEWYSSYQSIFLSDIPCTHLTIPHGRKNNWKGRVMNPFYQHWLEKRLLDILVGTNRYANMWFELNFFFSFCSVTLSLLTSSGSHAVSFLLCLCWCPMKCFLLCKENEFMLGWEAEVEWWCGECAATSCNPAVTLQSPFSQHKHTYLFSAAYTLFWLKGRE